MTSLGSMKVRTLGAARQGNRCTAYFARLADALLRSRVREVTQALARQFSSSRRRKFPQGNPSRCSERALRALDRSTRRFWGRLQRDGVGWLSAVNSAEEDASC